MQITISNAKVVIDLALSQCGIDEECRAIMIDSILFANQRGVMTHGIGRLPLYIHKIRAGHINPIDKVETVKDSGGTALLDAHNCLGQVAAYKATQIAIRKAKKYGVSAVGVRNSNNFGAAGYFGDIMARENMIGIICANAAPAIAPTGGTKTIFGTNPICLAFPGGENEDPVLLDMATTVAARGKIRLAAKNGEKIPLDWANGPNGLPTNDPNEALKGSLLPIGGYKGYGLSLFVDLVSGLLTGSLYGGDVKNLSKLDEDSGNGHFFIAIDTERYIKKNDLENKMKSFRERVKSCGSEGVVFLPGEKEYGVREKHNDTIEISTTQFIEINEVLSAMGIDKTLIQIEC